MLKLLEEAKRVLVKNRNYDGDHVYTVPDRSHHNVQFLWDSCWQVIGLRHIELKVAKSEIRSLLAGQWPNGKIPHTVHLKGFVGWINKLFTGHNTSWTIQPPVIAWAVKAIWDKTHDREFLSEIFPKLVDFYLFLRSARCYGPYGLMVIYHPWETGADDSPRFDPLMWTSRFKGKTLRVLAFIPKLWMYFRPLFMLNWSDTKLQEKRRPFLVPVDMNFYLAENLETMVGLANVLGKSHFEEIFRSWADDLKETMLKHMVIEGSFVDLMPNGGKLISAKTPFTFLPYLYGWADRELALSHFRSCRNFMTPYPVPTVSCTDFSYDPNAYWRGTTWVNINWIIIQGLRRIGEHQLAQAITEKTLNMIAENGIWEHYNSQTGKGVGAPDFGWTAALAIDLIYQENES